MVCVEEDGRAEHTHKLHDNSEAVAAGRDSVGAHGNGLLLDDLSVDALWQVLF